MSDSLRDTIRAVLADHEPARYEEEGDRWLDRPDPDTATLAVDHLADELAAAINEWWVEAFK